jgi:hypothetical protein
MGTTISKPSDVLDRASEIRRPSNLKLAFRELNSISNLQCDLLVPKSLPLVQVGERGLCSRLRRVYRAGKGHHLSCDVNVNERSGSLSVRQAGTIL